jgi:hypothetical protein
MQAKECERKIKAHLRKELAKFRTGWLRAGLAPATSRLASLSKLANFHAGY